ncbi:FAD-dependent monooxygenase [Streptomyces sp. HB2AG]|uniref:FAD-dependent monooxygenase n=1 Tax=Streptomyces sp. HB2AG TaxID=2983400 RepID=UPI0022AAB49E|nr:FAD-dependent monooxygenase [Streptomyces sp. HB2AG]MCZ2523595.1 FAD-dependent monooxygenase [Streptomyces sp. HB2AG]
MGDGATAGTTARTARTATADTDVTVVGAGPTGLLLATELDLAGVRVTVLERRTGRNGQSRALGLQPRTAEILRMRGLLAPLLARDEGLFPTALHFAGLPVPLDTTPWRTRHRGAVAVGQDRVEEFLEDGPAGNGVPVRRGCALTGLAQDADGVTAAFTGPGGRPGTVRSRWLVGCDGGRSTVRKLLGTPFPGTPGTVVMVAADVVLSEVPSEARPGALRSVGEAARAGGGVRGMMLPLREGVHRFMFSGPAQQRRDRAEPVIAAEVAEALAALYGGRAGLKEVRHATRFTDASRQAERYRTGRVLLAGDAAHIHLPTGGQGLNLGMQDAFNLGWKLAAAVRYGAGDDLLDSYHAERHPVGARVLRNTRAQGLLMAARDDDAVALREIVTDLLRLPGGNRYATGAVTGLDVSYPVPGSPPHPLLGARVPDADLVVDGRPTGLYGLLADGRGLLLELPGAAPGLGGAAGPWAGRVLRVRSADADGLDAAALLVRPDGHVCWASPDGGPAGGPDGLPAALARWFGPA